MTVEDYANEINSEIYNYLKSKVEHYQMDPFRLRFSLIIEPFKQVLDTPLVIQGEPYHYEAREKMEHDSNVWYRNKINECLDKIKSN